MDLDDRFDLSNVLAEQMVQVLGDLDLVSATQRNTDTGEEVLLVQHVLQGWAKVSPREQALAATKYAAMKLTAEKLREVLGEMMVALRAKADEIEYVLGGSDDETEDT